MGVLPAVWNTIKNYIASLSPNQMHGNRSRLTRLRAEIINLESTKERLIEIVEEHIRGRAGGRAASEDLRLSEIPHVLDQIDMLSDELTRMANDGDLFVAENSFRELKVNFDRKKADTLCRLAQEAASRSPDLLVMARLVNDLRDELKAIAAAEEALGKYIKESNR
jgi:hypothetical protein